MNRIFRSAAVIASLAAAICFVSPLAAQAQGRPQPGGAKANGPYYVVQIVNPPDDPATAGANAGANPGAAVNKYEVLEPSTLKTRQTELDKKYKDLLDKWGDERKIDSKIPKPRKPIIKKLNTFKTQEVANEYMQKLLDDDAKKAADKPKA